MRLVCPNSPARASFALFLAWASRPVKVAQLTHFGSFNRAIVRQSCHFGTCANPARRQRHDTSLKVVLADRYSQRADLDRRLTKLCEQTQTPEIQEEHDPGDALVPARFRLTDQLRACIPQDYRNGTPTTTIAIRYQLGKGTVLKALSEANVTMRRKPMSEAEIVKASELYAEGRSLGAIARELGHAQTTIRRKLTDRGVGLRPRPGFG